MKVSLEQAFIKLRNTETPFEQVMANGTMRVEIYKATKIDLQEPHTQDELYIIISGKSNFYNDGDTTNFKALDALFKPASKEHRFQNFTDDFATWIIFYGKQGGESV